jgi:ubiquitin-conjugating enzyme E2 Q
MSKTEIRPGDDEGSVEVVIAKSSSEHVLSANLLISGKFSSYSHLRHARISFWTDTSEYPASHSLFCYSPDGDLSSKLQRIVDELAEEPPRTLGKTVQELLGSVAKVVNAGTSKIVITIRDDSDSDEDAHLSGGGSEDYDAFEDYDDIGITPVEHDSIMAKLQE